MQPLKETVLVSMRSLNGGILEIFPERKSEAYQLADLKESCPVIGRTELAEVQKKQDDLYGNMGEIRAKLKERIKNIGLKAISSLEHEIELLYEIKLISSKIKAAGESI